MQTYGIHSIHGRAPAIATGLSSSRSDLSVWVVTGDGDALHRREPPDPRALRRNVNLKILLFNNQIYGLTKGQYSPTSPLGTHNKTTPFGSLDYPFNPVSLALGAEATFVARSIDTDKAHLTGVLRRAAEHRLGLRRDLPELQRLQRRRVRRGAERQGEPDLAGAREPIRFGGEGETLEQGVVSRPEGGVEIVDVNTVGEEVLRHDEARKTHFPRSPCPACPTHRSARRRSGSSARSSARSTTR